MQYIRRACGWADPVNIPTESCVCVFGHTSYFDIIPYLLYINELNEFIVFSPRYFKGFWWPLRYLFNLWGFIAAEKVEGVGKNGVETIANIIRKKEEETKKPVIMFICPKGTIQNKPWRTGYKHIAASLDWPIKVMLADHSKRTMKFVDTDTDDAEALQNILSDYCTIRPDRTEYPLRCDYDPYELKWPIDIVAVSCISYMVPALSALFYGQLIMSAQLLAYMYFAWLHHLSREKYYSRLGSILATLTAAYTVYTYPLTPLAILPTLAATYYYSIGNPRDPSQKRGPYVHTQSLFNLFASIAIWTLVA